jgi:23S rRNA pseudouridine955/2504/2580 synthase
VRIDGRRAQASARLCPGQTIRIPPLPAPEAAEGRTRPAAPRVDPVDVEWLRSRILYQDHALLVLDKPAGLAVQGGTKAPRHVDGMLQALAAGASDRAWSIAWTATPAASWWWPRPHRLPPG